jgi:hypothetical protein
MKKMLLTLVCISLATCASPAFAAKKHRHHLAPQVQAVPVVVPATIYLAPLGPRPAPFWGSYGARDEVRGSCGHWGAVFSCLGN